MYHSPSHLHIVLVHIGDIFYTRVGHTTYRTYNLSYVQVQKASNAVIAILASFVPALNAARVRVSDMLRYD